VFGSDSAFRDEMGDGASSGSGLSLNDTTKGGTRLIPSYNGKYLKGLCKLPVACLRWTGT
jgi:hypothetical protein